MGGNSMSTHSISNSRKCWSCEYYSCRRELKKGGLFSDSIYCDMRGTCVDPKSNSKGKSVLESNGCSKHVL